MTISRLTNSGLYSLTEYTGLENIGGWASVTAATGTFTKGSYTDSDGQWTYWQWTGSGSVTTTAGLVDMVVVGGGSGGYFIPTAVPGVSGEVIIGIHSLPSATNTVAIGAGGAVDAPGGVSSIDGISTRVAVWGAGYNGGVDGGVSSSITGSAVTYASYSSIGNTYGQGGVAGGAGKAGVSIIRVPTAFDLT